MPLDKKRLEKVKKARQEYKPDNGLRGDVYSSIKLGCYKKPIKPGGCQEGYTLYELIKIYRLTNKVQEIEKVYKELVVAGYICKVGHKRDGEDVWVISSADPKTGEIL